jgi:hypothetical protein
MMPTDNIITAIVSLSGVGVAITSTFLTVKSYYDKRRIEDRDRQREELERLQAVRTAELETYADAKNKAYAAERDFNHLMRKYDALSLSIDALMTYQKNEVQGLETDLKEVKGLLTAILVEIKGSETAVLRFLGKREGSDGI